MSTPPVALSIDQNCNSLWDVAPKLQALAARGVRAMHCIEDIDVAFTAVGARPGDPLRIERERFYRTGGQDWGAALFYSEFLGRLPVDLHAWEPYTGLKTPALARQLGRSVDDLYDEFSPGDNWQLIGPSYAEDPRFHRLIGDVGVGEAMPFIRELLDKARADCLRAFPAGPSQRRVREWFEAEAERLDGLLADCGNAALPELYRKWMGGLLDGAAELSTTSGLLALGAPTAGGELLELFTRDYDAAAGLYNEAMAESAAGPRPLDLADGELPFFAVLRRSGRLVRTIARLDGGSLRLGDDAFRLREGGLPVSRLREAGILCLAGKAPLLVLQARLTGPLALPYRGSLYMPAVHCLQRKLTEAGLLRRPLHPVLRVRLRLLDRMAELDAPLRLPAHLAAAFGREELPARDFAEGWRAVRQEAAGRLDRLREDDSREAWQQRAMPERHAERAELDARRRRMAAENPKAPELRELSHRVREIEAEVLDGTLRQIDRDWQVRDVDYWDSRGALPPWCVALGGEEFYNRLLAEAEVYEEPSHV